MLLSDRKKKKRAQSPRIEICCREEENKESKGFKRQWEEMCTESSPHLDLPVKAEVRPQESTAPAGGWQGSVADSGSDAWSAWQGLVGRDESSRCWPLMQAAKHMQMGLFQSSNLLATRHRYKEKAESVFVHIRPETHSSIFPSLPPPLKPQAIKSSMWDLG